MELEPKAIELFYKKFGHIVNFNDLTRLYIENNEPGVPEYYFVDNNRVSYVFNPDINQWESSHSIEVLFDKTFSDMGYKFSSLELVPQESHNIIYSPIVTEQIQLYKDKMSNKQFTFINNQWYSN